MFFVWYNDLYFIVMNLIIMWYMYLQDSWRGSFYIPVGVVVMVVVVFFDFDHSWRDLSFFSLKKKTPFSIVYHFIFNISLVWLNNNNFYFYLKFWFISLLYFPILWSVFPDLKLSRFPLLCEWHEFYFMPMFWCIHTIFSNFSEI